MFQSGELKQALDIMILARKILDKVEQAEMADRFEGRFSLPIYSSVDIRDSGFTGCR